MFCQNTFVFSSFYFLCFDFWLCLFVLDTVGTTSERYCCGWYLGYIHKGGVGRMDGTPCDAIKFNACTLTNLVTQLFMKAESHTMYIQALLYESMYVFSDFFCMSTTTLQISYVIRVIESPQSHSCRQWWDVQCRFQEPKTGWLNWCESGRWLQHAVDVAHLRWPWGVWPMHLHRGCPLMMIHLKLFDLLISHQLSSIHFCLTHWSELNISITLWRLKANDFFVHFFRIHDVITNNQDNEESIINTGTPWPAKVTESMACEIEKWKQQVLNRYILTGSAACLFNDVTALSDDDMRKCIRHDAACATRLF